MAFALLPRPILTHPISRQHRQPSRKLFPTCSTHHSTSSQSLDPFLNWCTTNKIQFNKIRLHLNDSYRTLIATSSITPGTPLLTLPRHTALIVDTTTPNPPHFPNLPLSKPFWQTAPWPTRLALHLLNHLLSNPPSPFTPYLSVLPQHPTTALWAYQKLGRRQIAPQLASYRLDALVDAQRKQVKSQYVALRAALPSHLRHTVSLADFAWAVSIAQSRGFGIPLPSLSAQEVTRRKVVSEPTQYALFPALDMANHSVHCPTSFTYDAVADAYIVSTGASFRPGDEVFLSYGPKCNDDLLLFYGFVEGNNPANAVIITDLREWILELGDVHGKDEDWDRKLAVFMEHDLTDPHRTFQFRRDSVPDDLLLLVRLAVASTSELNEFLQQLSENSDRLFKPLCLENELTTWAAVDAKCQELLNELGDFSEEEQRLLTSMFEKHPITAVWEWGQPGSRGELLYRYERQEVLAATSERVRHFAHVSSSIGQVCTVLLPPSQSLLKTNLFSGMGDGETAGVHRFDIAPEDLKFV